MNAPDKRLEPPAISLSAAVKFNPQLWTGDELRAIFVARKRELKQLTERLRTTPPTQVPQHVLITGHRGMGKSTLLHRLALEIESTETLRQDWVPLLFREEQYTVVALDRFWRNALDALAEALERRLPAQPGLQADIDTLDLLNATLDSLPDASAREDQARNGLLDWAQRRNARLALLVDSNDLLFESLSQDKSDPHRAIWRLRELLCRETRLLWIGTAYAPLEATHDYQHPFHEFFANISLRQLSISEMRTTFMALARAFGIGRGMSSRQAVTETNHIVEQHPERIETLLRLAGGNPRTIVVLYQLLASGGQDNVHADLQRLLDEMSALYKDRIENQLTPQPRQIVAILMEHWAPMSARDIADTAHIDVTLANAILHRLQANGWVETVKLPGTRRKGYAISERFFNIWYLMRLAPRRLRQRVTWLVEFMRTWFSRDELRKIARNRVTQHTLDTYNDVHQLEYSRAISLALPENCHERDQLEFVLWRKTIRGRIGDIVMFDVDGEDHAFAAIDDYRDRFFSLRGQLMPAITRRRGEQASAWIDLAMSSVSLTLEEKAGIAEKAETLSQFQVDELEKVFLEERAGWSTIFGDTSTETVFRRTLTGDFFPDAPDADLAVRQIRAYFSEDPDAYCMAMARACQFSTRDKLSELAVQDGVWQHSIRPAALAEFSSACVKLECYETARIALQRAIELTPESAALWHRLGNLLREQLQRYDEAEQAYRQAIALDPKSAYAWNGLGDLQLYRLQRYDEAEQAYRQAIALDPKSAYAWNRLGDLLQYRLQRYDEAEQAYRQAIALDPKSAYAWNRLGDLLQYSLQRYDEAEQAYRQAIPLSPKSASPWYGLGNLLQEHLQRYNEAEQAYRQVIALDSKFAASWNGLGCLLQNHLQRYDEAEQAYRQAIALDSKFAASWNGLGCLLQNHLKRHDEADLAYREAIALAPDEPMFLANLARLTAQRGETIAATKLFRQTLILFMEKSESDQASNAFLALQAHLWLGNRDAALEALHTLCGRLESERSRTLFRLDEQARECHQLGRGRALADLMAASSHADFLRPMILALYLLDGNEDATLTWPLELQHLAREIADEWQLYASSHLSKRLPS